MNQRDSSSQQGMVRCIAPSGAHCWHHTLLLDKASGDLAHKTSPVRTAAGLPFACRQNLRPWQKWQTKSLLLECVVCSFRVQCKNLGPQRLGLHWQAGSRTTRYHTQTLLAWWMLLGKNTQFRKRRCNRHFQVSLTSRIDREGTCAAWWKQVGSKSQWDSLWSSQLEW